MKIAEVAEINARSVQKDFPFREIEYIDISSVGTGVFNSAPAVLNLDDAPGRARRLVQPGDTIISTVRPNRRSFLYLKSPGKNTVVSTGFAVVSPREQVDSRYLYYWISRPEFSEYLAAHAKGAAYPAVAPEDIGAAKIDLPPLPEQRRIASILSSYDDLIENNLRRIKILEDMAGALYREWFVEFRFPGHAKISHVASALGPIPKGWGVKSVPEAVQINPRVVVPKDREIAFIPMGSLSNDSMLIADVECRVEASGSRFQNGDTLFARITPCLENGKTGFVQFLPNADQVACGSTEFIVLRSRTLTPEFVYLLARSQDFRAHAIKSMTGASGRQRVQEKCFDSLHLAEPPRPLLDLFSGIVAPNFLLAHKLQMENTNLRATRDLLLPRLLSDGIPAEADVPA